jgi:MFS family permease
MHSLDRLSNYFHVPWATKRPTGFQALMANYAVFQLAAGMLASFGVLYIYLLGDDLMSGLKLMAVFFFLQRLVTALVVPLVGKMVFKLGYRWMVFMSILAMIAKTFILMKVNQTNLWLLGPALMLGGLSIAAYYVSYHGMFLTDNDDNKIGQQMGLVTMVGRMGVMIAPLLAGLLIQQYSYSVMFIVAIGLLMLSALPLFTLPHHDHSREKFEIKDAFKLLKKREGFLDSTTWWSLENGLQVFYWPILLFLIVGSFVKFGAIGSGVMIANGLAVYLSGKLYDKRKLVRAYPIFTGLVVVSNVMRYFSKTLVMGVASDSLNRVTSPFWWMKIRRNSILDGEKYEPIVFAVAWEWAVCLGYLVSLALGYLILSMSQGHWPWLIVPAVIANIVAAVGVRKDE